MVYSRKGRSISQFKPPRCPEITPHSSSYHAHAPVFLSQNSWEMHTWYRDSGPMLNVLSCRLHTGKKSYRETHKNVDFWRPRQCLKLLVCVASHFFRFAQCFKLQLCKTTLLMRWENVTAIKWAPLTYLFFILTVNNMRQEIGRTQMFQWLHR